MKKIKTAVAGILVLALLFALCFFAIRAAFPRKYRTVAEGCGVEPALVYAVMKAESGFNEHAKSHAGAIGLMQLKPSTAEFICTRESIPFEPERLEEGEYNTVLGCKYLIYLLDKFPVVETALAAYNAGEGTVSKWLQDKSCSDDGVTLFSIPYAETQGYIKKIVSYRKIYRFLY